MRTRHFSFTLTELLVVLAITAMLIALVAGAVQGVRRSARERGCVANLQRLSMALALYVGDYDDTYPVASPSTFTKVSKKESRALGGRLWCHVLAPYVDQGSGSGSGSGAILHCPGFELEDVIPADYVRNIPRFTTADKLKLSGYAYNVELSERVDIDAKRDTYSGKGLGAVEYSALTVSFAESRAGVMVVNEPDERVEGRIRAMFILEFAEAIQRQPSGASRHRGGANYAFCDGHVKWLTPRQFRTSARSDGYTPGFGP